MTERPRRKRLIPSWVAPTMIAIATVVAVAMVSARANYLASLVEVPDVVGRPTSVAEQNTSLAGLSYSVSGSQFSADIAEGSVISQSPVAGDSVRRGSAVAVTLSAGHEHISLPDIVGLSLTEARAVLKDLGLGVITSDVVSPALAGTVVESFPSAGTEIQTGSTVRLSVAIGGAPVDSLLPFDMEGTVVGIDPEPVRADAPDVTLDVARRLRSLIEASGGEVVVTRSITETSPPESVRVSILTSPTPDVTVGLSFATGGGGVTAIAVRLESGDVPQSATVLAESFTVSVRLPGQSVNAFRTDGDAVLGKVVAPGIRALLGDPSDAQDASRFTDPEWADAVARALYRALGETFGHE